MSFNSSACAFTAFVVLTDKLIISNTEVVIKVQWRLMIGVFKKITYYAAVALLGQGCSPKIARQEAHIRLRLAANCRHQKFKKILL